VQGLGRGPVARPSNVTSSRPRVGRAAATVNERPSSRCRTDPGSNRDSTSENTRTVTSPRRPLRPGDLARDQAGAGDVASPRPACCFAGQLLDDLDDRSEALAVPATRTIVRSAGGPAAAADDLAMSSGATNRRRITPRSSGSARPDPVGFVDDAPGEERQDVAQEAGLVAVAFVEVCSAAFAPSTPSAPPACSPPADGPPRTSPRSHLGHQGLDRLAGRPPSSAIRAPSPRRSR